MTDYVLPGRSESGTGYTYEARYEVLRVLDPDAGPCKVCDKPMVRLEAKQHVNHNDHRYTSTFDFLYAHTDGSEPHDGQTTNCVKPRCPRCHRYDTLTFQQTGYGDATDCSACGYHHFYDIGD